MNKTLETAFTVGVHGKFKRRAYTKFSDELWTFRKVLRRFVEHEKEHIGTIQRVVDAF